MSSRLAPWTSTREWRRVADALVGADDGTTARGGGADAERDDAAGRTTSEESLALRTVDAWRARGRVPLAVDVTAALVDAMRRDDGSTASSSSSRGDGGRGARLEYAMTLVRLVNGAVDPTQKGRYAAPIATLASKIHLPQELVDLRHEATHDALPSLRALRRGARLALAWCRTWYWDKQRRAFEETTEAMRRCVWELCENEGRARVLAAREGSKYAPSSSEDEDDDEEDGGAGGRSNDATFDFKSVRERRRGLLGKLGSLCPKGASHALSEALSECWPTVVRGDDDAGAGATLGYEEFSAAAPVDSRDWQPTLGRLCQKWPGLFVHVLEDRLTHGNLRDDDVLGQIEAMIELGLSAELADSSQKEIVASAMRRALVSDCWRARDACDDARVKKILKSLQKATGASKEDLKSTQSGELASGLSALEEAKAAQAALVESMASGRKRKRDSRWEHVEEWTPCPIGLVPGVDLSRLHCVTETALRVSSGVASFDGDAAFAYRAPIVDEDDEDGCDDEDCDVTDDDDMDEDHDIDDDDGDNLETEAEAGALNVGGVRVKLSKEQRASVAASVACLL